MIGFTSVLIRMYINFVSEALSELDVTLKDEDLMFSAIYEMSVKLMYIFGDQDVSFFFDLFVNLRSNCCKMNCFIVKNQPLFLESSFVE